LKTPKTIGLLAVPVVLAAAIVSATCAFANAPAHQSAAASLATVKFSSAGSADAVKPAVASVPASVPAAAPSQATTEPTESATEPASTETTDAAGGHADNPNDPNADHQFNGEE
jgi:FlaG/FlaF family flagellin (archaellin)